MAGGNQGESILNTLQKEMEIDTFFEEQSDIDKMINALIHKNEIKTIIYIHIYI